MKANQEQEIIIRLVEPSRNLDVLESQVAAVEAENRNLRARLWLALDLLGPRYVLARDRLGLVP